MSRRFWAHVGLAVVGVAAVLWALTLGAHPTIECRGVEMRPGDVCANAEGTRVQTYEERMTAHQQARPVVGGVGGVLAAFGVGLAVAQRRDVVRGSGSSGRTRPDHPRTA